MRAAQMCRRDVGIVVAIIIAAVAAACDRFRRRVYGVSNSIATLGLFTQSARGALAKFLLALRCFALLLGGKLRLSAS